MQNTHSNTRSSNGGLTLLGLTHDGKKVLDRPNSHHHLSRHLLLESIAMVNAGENSFIETLITFDRIVGESTCVATGPNDRIVYALRRGRRGMSRLVLGRRPEPCSTVFLVLKQLETEPGAYLLITGFVGGRPAPEPWDRNATANSLPFWQCHGLIVQDSEIDQDTVVPESDLGLDRRWPEPTTRSTRVRLREDSGRLR